jgi:NAD-dependent dihydropyrimidine dehydrogenase PreA subunit
MTEREADTAGSTTPASWVSEARLVPNPATPCRAIVIDPDLCNGCNRCVDVCRCDVLMPAPEKGSPPILTYPDECWFCACCAEHCPVPGALTMEQPLNQRVGWKRKATGEHFRIGQKNPPPPNTRPPVGGWGRRRRSQVDPGEGEES